MNDTVHLLIGMELRRYVTIQLGGTAGMLHSSFHCLRS